MRTMCFAHRPLVLITGIIFRCTLPPVQLPSVHRSTHTVLHHTLQQPLSPHCAPQYTHRLTPYITATPVSPMCTTVHTPSYTIHYSNSCLLAVHSIDVFPLVAFGLRTELAFFFCRNCRGKTAAVKYVYIGTPHLLLQNLDCTVPVATRSKGRPAAAYLLRLWVRIQLRAWMSVCCLCRILSGRGLCEGPIPRPEKSYG